ncbi:1-acyl-sn-glycerol-3-phosphate acyltransferase [Pelomonas sp. KK5]|uniref:1-acyl-sn-glycerol-3-phosphate acyltransferase n=1 Tax=Pelomonas sp. KK5 TaxID=1855730 RepID=UPI0009FADDA4|nr:1-acyl-sn-glycerol-3-phosphate acyltransferase [Pelomonas sp. KK5]
MTARDALVAPRLIDGPRIFKPAGSALARRLMGLFGWKVDFDGLPALQGVVMVYPHTSNWDFIVGIFAKWALGLQVRYWAKDSLFRLPLFGAWLRWVGGIAVNRKSRHGIVADTAQQMLRARDRNELFWLAVTPEGTRSLGPGWRSGAYQVALQAQVPVGLVYFDYATRTVGFTTFVQISGDAGQDLALIARHLAHAQGRRPELASPIRFTSSP